MNRAQRRASKRVAGYDEADVRLWDHEPHVGHRWYEFLRLVDPSLVSEINRDAEFASVNGWQFTYFPDGSKTVEKGRARITFPAGCFQ